MRREKSKTSPTVRQFPEDFGSDPIGIVAKRISDALKSEAISEASRTGEGVSTVRYLTKIGAMAAQFVYSLNDEELDCYLTTGADFIMNSYIENYKITNNTSSVPENIMRQIKELGAVQIIRNSVPPLPFHLSERSDIQKRYEAEISTLLDIQTPSLSQKMSVEDMYDCDELDANRFEDDATEDLMKEINLSKVNLS